MKSISEITKYMDDLRALIFDLYNVLYSLDDYVKSGFHQISWLFLGHGQAVYDRLWSAYQEQNTADADSAVAETIHLRQRKYFLAKHTRRYLGERKNPIAI